MASIKYNAYGNTDQGLVRSRNEDAFLLNKELNVFAVADGLGGLPHGDIASQTAILELEKQLSDNAVKDSIDFDSIFKSVQDAVNNESKKVQGEFGIATTLTAAKIIGKTLFIGHIGDSGLFVFKKDQWMKLTTDHTMAQEMRDEAGAEKDIYIPDYYNHVLTQCIGQVKGLRVETIKYRLESGDRMLFYSDGVTKAWKVEELHELAFKSDGAESFARSIIEEANNRGGIDNVTAVAVFID